MSIIQGQGCSSAKLMIIGESYGNELFSGFSGKLLDEALEYGGITRSECYLLGITDKSELQDIRNEIYTVDPNCILTLGEVGLNLVTSNKGVMHYRGSILDSNGTSHKVVSTLHPAGLTHESKDILDYKAFTWIKFDVKRAVEQSAFKGFQLPQRNLHIARNSYDVYSFLNKYQGQSLCALDVETFKTFAQCIGLSFSPSEAISIPIFTDKIAMHDLGYIWKLIYEFLNDTKIQIIAQNAKFDEKRCRQLGLKWINPCYFSMDMAWHVLFPEFPKKLEFIASILTEEPYYKDEGKEFNPKIHSMDRWYLYNAKDAAVEYECAIKIIQELKDRNLYKFYFDKIAPLYKLYYDIEDVGILIDQDINKKLKAKYQNLWDTKQEELVNLIADCNKETYELFKNFNVMSNGPKNQVAKLLFGYLKCPMRASTDDETLKSLANNSVKSTRIKDIIYHILEIRKIRKTIGTYLEAEVSNGEAWLI